MRYSCAAQTRGNRVRMGWDGLVTRRGDAFAARLAAKRRRLAAEGWWGRRLGLPARQKGHVGEEQAGRPGGRGGLCTEAAEEAETQRKGPEREAGAAEPGIGTGRGRWALAARPRAESGRRRQLSLQAQQVGDGEAAGARAGGGGTGRQRRAPRAPFAERVSARHGFSVWEA